MSDHTVAVVGGGIGGLVLGLALRERGIGFEVYEQADELREVGAAVALSANGTRELRRLGVGEQVEEVSVVPSALVIRRWDTGEIITAHPIGRDGTYEATFGVARENRGRRPDPQHLATLLIDADRHRHPRTPAQRHPLNAV